MLAELPEISEVHLEANNRTWDSIAEAGDNLGVFTERARRLVVWD